MPTAKPRRTIRPAAWILLGLAALNICAWLWAAASFSGQPALLGSAMLAWLFGLRHAADADHLAAIDNVVRKLMQEGQRPHLTGLFFSLGHSTVVILACIAIGLTASSQMLEVIHGLGGVVGTLVSVGFLVAVAVVNLLVLLRLLRNRPAHGGAEQMLEGRGLLVRILRPAVRLIRRPAHMFPLGFLFGLGFDTASEVGLLAISATQVAAGLSFNQILIFPALFTAGMALVDTADSVLMAGAYAWALMDPDRKRVYNILVTALSVALAFCVAGIEGAGLLGEQLGLQGPAFRVVDMLNAASGQIGFFMIALFASIWAISMRLYRRRPGVAAGVQPKHPSGRH